MFVRLYVKHPRYMIFWKTVVQTRQGLNIGFAIIADRLIAAFKDNPDIEVWNNLLEVAKIAGKTDDTDVLQYLKYKMDRRVHLLNDLNG